MVLMTDKTSLGDRMKGQYENRTRTYLPRRTYTIIRLDGKAFHTYTRGCEKPYDVGLSETMQRSAEFLCTEAQGAVLGYVQSDEISVLLTDFASTQTDAWFDGNVQKVVSVAASIVTATFNHMRPERTAFFDARTFTIPDPTEVVNYFIWRQKDCVRNSISSLAQAHFSHAQLHGKNCDAMQEMLWQEKGINWSESNPTFKNGALLVRGSFPGGRTHWTSGPAPIFTQDRDSLVHRIPVYA